MLDIDLIQRKMTELRMGGVEFARRVGVSLDTLRAARTATISIDLALRICDALDIDLAELVGRRREDRPRPPADDDRVLEAALAQHGQVAEQDLAEALGWSLARVRESAEDLSLRLAQTALHLLWTDAFLQVQPRPGVLPAEVSKQLQTLQHARLPLSPDDAAILLHLIRADRDLTDHHLTVNRHILIDWEAEEHLIRQGITAERDRRGPAELTSTWFTPAPHEDVLFGLGLGVHPRKDPS
ncbi:helix-turn-helix transcriptional regulator [Nonomuraea sp. NPDC049695]|uniref:helix-turn-helix domain-containing protein n=1 Tax=Nonomuraea sp. NPDC049695 TaxID=3154734 RepID=UPI0034237EF0